ncbi:MAG: NADH-quinone oxidoreductase subunit J [Phycisphaerales bacterium]|jgi:NADH-quinone oxidoreductase subunit J|nr:NADH-quinone oxidoreductase subunit J [Phycisphaerales bacterium]
MGVADRTLRSQGRPLLNAIINPIALYLLIALAGVGVCLALPRKGPSPQALGGLLAAAGFGGLVLALTLWANESGAIPNPYFYVFGLVALGAGLRVVTHPRPVYAALYFILVVLASAGLLLILSAEFMAFAMIIVYAGAILITYLFVIMLATQAPSEDMIDALADYDRQSREPVGAAVAGFVLLAAMTTLLFRGIGPTEAGDHAPGHGAPALVAKNDASADAALLLRLPGKVETELRELGLMEHDEALVRDASGALMLDPVAREAVVVEPDGTTRVVSWPEGELNVQNIEGLGFNLLDEHPGSIEIAGVILLMAMLGAVVLSRKQVEMDEEAKARQARRLSAELQATAVERRS